MKHSRMSFSASGRGIALATVCALTVIAAGCSSDDDPAPVGSDPATPTTPAPTTPPPTTPPPAGTPGTPGTPPVATPSPITPAPGGGVSTSRFCDEGSGGTVPAQQGDPAVDDVAAAQPGAPVVTASAVSCSLKEGSLEVSGVAAQRDLAMDRANLAFLVNGEVVVSGADAFRWVDSREYCAKPAPATLGDGTVRELVAKFAPDTNQPTYYREKSSQADGTFISQLECYTGVQTGSQ